MIEFFAKAKGAAAIAFAKEKTAAWLCLVVFAKAEAAVVACTKAKTAVVRLC